MISTLSRTKKSWSVPFLFAFLSFLLLALVNTATHAASYTLPLVIGTAPFGCALVSGTTYDCPASITLGVGDSVAASSASLTLNVTGNVTIPNNVTWGNSSFNINVIATGTVTLGNSNNTNFFGNITAATIDMGNNASVSGICTTNSSFSNSGNCAGGAFINGCTSSTSGTVTTVTCTANGTFTPPSGITLALVEAWGGGGGGGNSTSTTLKGGGGAGGQYAYKLTAVSAGTSYNVVVGQGGGSATAGSDSRFSTTTVVAKGGAAGSSNGASHGAGGLGSTTGGVGDFVFSGGNGASGSSSGGGGGGGGAGNTGNGGNATTTTRGTGNVTGGGNGGSGPTTNSDGAAGGTYGGGGSGANKTSGGDKTGGAGANGVVIITYSASTPSPIADWRMDETAAFTGVAGEVKSSVGGGTDATARRNANNSPISAPFPGNISGKLCNAINLNGANYLQVTGLSSQLSGTASLSFWINTTQLGNNTPWSAPGVTGVEINTSNDIFWGYINATGKIGLQKGSAAGAQSTSLINNGAWRHIILTRNTSSPGESKIYVDGVLENTVNMADLSVVTTAFSSLGRIEGSFSPSSLIGGLDEVKVFAPVLTATQVASIYANESSGKNWDGSARVCPVAGPDHMEIIHSSGTGLTCTASTLTVRACANAACTTLYTGGVSGTLTATGTPTVNWDGTTGGAAGAGFVIPAGSSSVSKNVQVTTVGSVVFGVTTPTTPAASNATTCNFGSPSCTFTSSSAGFLVNVPNHSSCIAQTVTLRAVQSNATSTACVPAFSGVNRNVSLYSGYTNPTTGTRTASLNYVTSSGGATTAVASLSVSSGSPTTLTNLYFDATGTARLTGFTYPDVGQVTLFPTYTGSAGTNDAGLSMAAASGNVFIAAPASFSFSAIPAAPLTAGSPFNATVTALNACSTPAATPNFGKETTPATAVLTSSNPVPALGNATAINLTVSGFNAGAASTNVTWREVGTVDLVATSANYLGSGLTGTGTQAAVGRFKPAYLETSLVQGCSSFTYSGQPLAVTVTAKAAGGVNTTANYAGSTWARQVTLTDANSIVPPLGAFNPPTSADVQPTAFIAGVATATPTYSFTSPATVPTAIKVRATDTDSVDSSTGNTGLAASAVEGTSTIYSGRIRLFNANGSELLPLPITARVENYFASGGVNGWYTSTVDSCSTLSAGNFAFSYPATSSTFTNNIGACTTGVSSADFSGSPPTYSIRLKTPGTGKSGATDLTLNLGASASGSTCTCTNALAATSCSAATATTASRPWLQFNWSGSTANPTARATFGVSKSGPQIHLRELY